MSRSFGTNSGSFESLKRRRRCGAKPCARQMRWTEETLTPTALGLSGILCAGPVDHHARMNLSSNMMANWVFASPHSRGDIFHSVAV